MKTKKDLKLKVLFYNIDWDGSSNNLPNKVILEIPNDIDVSLEGADILSDIYGYCVNGFNFKIKGKV